MPIHSFLSSFFNYIQFVFVNYTTIKLKRKKCLTVPYWFSTLWLLSSCLWSLPRTTIFLGGGKINIVIVAFILHLIALISYKQEIYLIACGYLQTYFIQDMQKWFITFIYQYLECVSALESSKCDQLDF